MSQSCKECAHNNSDFIDNVCLDCYWPEFAEEPSNFEPKPVTNADRIRSKTDEELAHTLWLTAKGGIIGQRSENEWFDWLRHEAE